MPPKIRIKKKILSTPKEQFQELLQGKYNEIYDVIRDEFGIDKNKKITSQLDNIKSKVEELFFSKSNITEFNTIGINSFQYKFSQKCSANQLGKVQSSHTIINNDAFSNLMLFRMYNPIESNILKAIHYNKTTEDFNTEQERFLAENMQTVDSDILSNDFTNFENKNDRDNKEILRKMLNILSNFYNTSYIIYSPTHNKLYTSGKKNVGNWFTTNEVLKNINKRDLCILFLIVNNQKVTFEPIIFLDIHKKKITQNVDLTIPNKSAESDPIPNNVHTHLISLIENKSIRIIEKSVTNQKTIVNKMKIDSVSEVYFNPYDKNVKLPTIELTLVEGKKEYLIGNLYGKFRNIYTKEGNNLAGKVNLQETGQKLDVYWCDGYPK